MPRPTIRVLCASAIAAGLLLLLLLPGAALGGPVSRERDRGLFIECDFLTSDDGTLFFGAFLSEGSAPNAGLDAFGPGDEPFEDPPTFVTSDADQTGSYADGVLDARDPGRGRLRRASRPVRR